MKVINILLILLYLSLTACGGGNPQPNPNPTPVSGVYFIADKDAPAFDELYITEVGQILPRKLSKMPDNGFDNKVKDYKLSPDNKWVAYVVVGIAGGAGNELYIVPTIGGEPVYIVGDLTGQEPSVNEYEWAPDGSSLAFTTYHYSVERNLYVTNPYGTGIIKVSEDFDPVANSNGEGVGDFYWAPDSQYIAYNGALGTTSRYELYIVRPNGTDHKKLSKTLSANGFGVNSVTWSPDAQKLSFFADINTWGDYDLYTINRDGTGYAKITDNTLTGGINGDYQWSSNSVHLAYLAFVNGQAELYTVYADGSNTTRVSGAATATQGAGEFSWSPDSSRIAYITDLDADDVYELYTVKPDGTEHLKVSGSLIINGYVTGYFDWSPDSSHLAYIADQDTDSLFELYTVKPNGLDNIKVSGSAVVSLGQIDGDFLWSPDSQRIAFKTVILTNTNMELYSVKPDGTDLITNSGSLIPNGHVISFAWSNDSSQLAFVADQDIDNIFELHKVGSDALNLIKVSGDAFAGQSVKSYQFEN